MKLKNYFGDRAFYKLAFSVSVPVMLQNLITNLVSMIDNIMVGRLGTEQMSGVAIVNQITLVYILALFGAMSGIGIFTAQFYGKGDNEGVRYTLRYKLIQAAALWGIGLLVFGLFSKPLISLFLHESEAEGDIALTMRFAEAYLRVMLIGLLPIALTQALSGTLRESGDTFTPMIAGMTAVFVNCVFNYILIFGKLGFPALGVRGAAAATVLARFVECGIIIVYMAAKRARFPYLRGLFSSLRVPRGLLARMTVKGMPLLVNELLWSGGMSALSVAFSLHGLNVVAAYSISSTVSGLFSVAFMAMGVGIGIIVGQNLGAGEYDKAVENVRRLITLSVLLSVAIGTVMFFTGGLVTGFYNTGEDVKRLAAYFIRVWACVMPLHAFSNASYFTLRSGGKTVITFIFDSGSVWVLMVPAAFALYYIFGLNIYAVYPIVMSLEILKDLIGYLMVKKKIWIKTIV